MTPRSEKRSTASLAGWLFADLSIVLMILFASTGLTSDDLRCEKENNSIAESPCKRIPTSTISPDKGNGNVRPKPIVMTIERARSMSAATFQRQIEREIQRQEKTDASLKGASDWDFGVVIIYGAGRGLSTKDGVRVARDIQKKLSPDSKLRWRKVRMNTFYETGFTNEVSYGSVKMKLFPIISE